MGVTSRIIVILDPGGLERAHGGLAAGPRTLHVARTERTPCSIAFLAHSSAAICAAKGVDLREPLKPCWPALDHATAFPPTSVIVMIVLLNVDWMWATPVWTFFLTFFFAPFFTIADSYFFVGAFFLPATVFRGPLRVRALVWVR